VKTVILAALVAFALWVIFTFVGLAKFQSIWDEVARRV
jgi:hypothetical protein